MSKSLDLDKPPAIEPIELLPPNLPKAEEVPQPQPEKPLNPDDAWQLWKKTNSDEDFQRVLKALDPVIKKGVFAFGNNQPYLITRARILAAEAIKMYNPEALKKENSRQASLSTYVYSSLQRLQRIAADRAEAVRIPERSRMDAILLRSTINDYVDMHGVEPDLATLSDLTGLSKKRIQAASRAFREISAAGLETEKGDTLLTVEENENVENDPWRDYVYYDLDSKGRKIFEWTTGYGGSKILPKQEIARRLHMTPAAVSSRINTIMKRINERPTGKII